MGNKEFEISMEKNPYNLKNQAYLIDSMIIMTILFLLDGQTYHHHATIR